MDGVSMVSPVGECLCSVQALAGLTRFRHECLDVWLLRAAR
jgi:hypothetical protein